jgi:hypothetical protein
MATMTAFCPSENKRLNLTFSPVVGMAYPFLINTLVYFFPDQRHAAQLSLRVHPQRQGAFLTGRNWAAAGRIGSSPDS